MNICIDIDGTITNAYYWVNYMNEHFNLNLVDEDIIYYDLCKVAKVTEEQFEDFYRTYSDEIHGNAVIRENAKQVLENIAHEHNIYYVTARDSSLKKITEEWFQKTGLPKGQLFMLGSHNKVKKAMELKCDLFIEDRYENAIELSQSGIRVLLIDCYYNRHALNNNIKRVTDWTEIKEEIHMISKEKKYA
ncbi:5' nucleotidase, NT5C type [Oceanirhabdus seepicola]|nr:hypothetical protein [Oceanirhabdus seepicola]